MVSKGKEQWHGLGRHDGNGEHLPVKPVGVSIENNKVEEVCDWLIVGLKRGGVAVEVKHRQGNTSWPCI